MYLYIFYVQAAVINHCRETDMDDVEKSFLEDVAKLMHEQGQSHTS